VPGALIGGEADPRGLGPGGARFEDDLDIGQRSAGPAAAGQHRLADIVGNGPVIGQIDEAVAREIRMQDDVHQSLQPAGADLGHAGDRLRIEHAVTDDSQIADALGDQHVAVRQECDRPWLTQIARDDDDAQLAMLGHGRFDQERPVPERRRAPLYARRDCRRCCR
jgi:hypothetical protein